MSWVSVLPRAEVKELRIPLRRPVPVVSAEFAKVVSGPVMPVRALWRALISPVNAVLVPRDEISICDRR